MEVFIFCVAIGIIVLFAVFALGFNLGRGDFDYEGTDKGELHDNNSSDVMHYDANNNDPSVDRDNNEEKHN